MDSRESLVELVFGKCTLVYGREFLNRWEGVPLAEVKADWQRELGALLDKPQAIKHALEHLPVDRPPTVLQFRALCVNRPITAVLALPEPHATPQRRAEVRSLLQQGLDLITVRHAA